MMFVTMSRGTSECCVCSDAERALAGRLEERTDNRVLRGEGELASLKSLIEERVAAHNGSAAATHPLHVIVADSDIRVQGLAEPRHSIYVSYRTDGYGTIFRCTARPLKGFMFEEKEGGEP